MQRAHQLKKKFVQFLLGMYGDWHFAECENDGWLINQLLAQR